LWHYVHPLWKKKKRDYYMEVISHCPSCHKTLLCQPISWRLRPPSCLLLPNTVMTAPTSKTEPIQSPFCCRVAFAKALFLTLLRSCFSQYLLVTLWIGTMMCDGNVFTFKRWTLHYFAVVLSAFWFELAECKGCVLSTLWSELAECSK